MVLLEEKLTSGEDFITLKNCLWNQDFLKGLANLYTHCFIPLLTDNFISNTKVQQSSGNIYFIMIFNGKDPSLCEGYKSQYGDLIDNARKKLWEKKETEFVQKIHGSKDVLAEKEHKKQQILEVLAEKEHEKQQNLDVLAEKEQFPFWVNK